MEGRQIVVTVFDGLMSRYTVDFGSEPCSVSSALPNLGGTQNFSVINETLSHLQIINKVIFK